MNVYQVDVYHCRYNRKYDWLSITGDEDIDAIDDDKSKSYVIYFAEYEDVSKYIDEVTVEHNQFWYDRFTRTDGDVEHLEYHNGTEWDSEMHIEIKKVRLHQSLVDTILNLHTEDSNG